jgi:hypothetical protein
VLEDTVPLDAKLQLRIAVECRLLEELMERDGAVDRMQHCTV